MGSKNRLSFHPTLFLLVLVASLATGRHFRAKKSFGDGFFIANEGWFGHEPGSVSFSRYGSKSLQLKVYEKENPDKPLGTNATTLQFGTVFGKRLYLVVKAGGPLVEADPGTLQERRRIEQLPGDNGQSFLGVDERRALLGAGDGLYRVDLATLTVGDKVAGVDGAVGDLAIANGHVYAIADNERLYVLSADGYGVEEVQDGVAAGFAVTADGHVWALGTDWLLDVRPDLPAEQVPLPFAVPDSYGVWRPGPIAYSEHHNAVFFVRQTAAGDATDIYRYEIGESGSVDEPFITVPHNYSIYGAIGYDRRQRELVVTVIRSGRGLNSQYNLLLFYDPVSGTLKRSVPYKGFYFPAMVIFHDDQ